jgi:hypothetical protein
VIDCGCEVWDNREEDKLARDCIVLCCIAFGRYLFLALHYIIAWRFEFGLRVDLIVLEIQDLYTEQKIVIEEEIH